MRALVLTPTRELAVQVKNHIEAIAKYTDIKAAVIVGGMAVQKQIRYVPTHQMLSRILNCRNAENPFADNFFTFNSQKTGQITEWSC